MLAASSLPNLRRRRHALPAAQAVLRRRPLSPIAIKILDGLCALGGTAPWQLQGRGTLPFCGFKDYDASLWITVLTPSAANPCKANDVYALEIVYNTGLKADELAISLWLKWRGCAG